MWVPQRHTAPQVYKSKYIIYNLSQRHTHTPPCVVFRNTSCHTFTASLLPHWHVPLTCCPDTKLLTTTLTSFHITFLLYLHTHWHIDNSASFCKLGCLKLTREWNIWHFIYTTDCCTTTRHNYWVKDQTSFQSSCWFSFLCSCVLGVYIYKVFFCFLPISSKQVQAVSLITTTQRSSYIICFTLCRIFIHHQRKWEKMNPGTKQVQSWIQRWRWFVFDQAVSPGVMKVRVWRELVLQHSGVVGWLVKIGCMKIYIYSIPGLKTLTVVCLCIQDVMWQLSWAVMA